MADPFRAVLKVKLEPSTILLFPLMYKAPPRPRLMSVLSGIALLNSSIESAILALEPRMYMAPPFLVTLLDVKLEESIEVPYPSISTAAPYSPMLSWKLL